MVVACHLPPHLEVLAPSSLSWVVEVSFLLSFSPSSLWGTVHCISWLDKIVDVTIIR